MLYSQILLGLSFCYFPHRLDGSPPSFLEPSQSCYFGTEEGCHLFNVGFHTDVFILGVVRLCRNSSPSQHSHYSGVHVVVTFVWTPQYSDPYVIAGFTKVCRFDLWSLCVSSDHTWCLIHTSLRWSLASFTMYLLITHDAWYIRLSVDPWPPSLCIFWSHMMPDTYVSPLIPGLLHYVSSDHTWCLIHPSLRWSLASFTMYLLITHDAWYIRLSVDPWPPSLCIFWSHMMPDTYVSPLIPGLLHYVSSDHTWCLIHTSLHWSLASFTMYLLITHDAWYIRLSVDPWPPSLCIFWSHMMPDTSVSPLIHGLLHYVSSDHTWCLIHTSLRWSAASFTMYLLITHDAWYIRLSVDPWPPSLCIFWSHMMPDIYVSPLIPGLLHHVSSDHTWCLIHTSLRWSLASFTMYLLITHYAWYIRLSIDPRPPSLCIFWSHMMPDTYVSPLIPGLLHYVSSDHTWCLIHTSLRWSLASFTMYLLITHDAWYIRLSVDPRPPSLCIFWSHMMPDTYVSPLIPGLLHYVSSDHTWCLIHTSLRWSLASFTMYLLITHDAWYIRLSVDPWPPSLCIFWSHMMPDTYVSPLIPGLLHYVSSDHTWCLIHTSLRWSLASFTMYLLITHDAWYIRLSVDPWPPSLCIFWSHMMPDTSVSPLIPGLLHYVSSDHTWCLIHTSLRWSLASFTMYLLITHDAWYIRLSVDPWPPSLCIFWSHMMPDTYVSPLIPGLLQYVSSDHTWCLIHTSLRWSLASFTMYLLITHDAWYIRLSVDPWPPSLCCSYCSMYLLLL